jgi:hypothetical protein
MKNWKTTSTGLVMILGAIANVYFSFKGNSLSQGVITGSTTAFLGGIGLLFSKDYNVTGGTVINVPNDAAAVQAATKTNQ